MRITLLTDHYLSEGYTLAQSIALAVQDRVQPTLEIHDYDERQDD